VSIARKLRAMLGMGVVWGLAWIPLALGSVVLLGLRAGHWPTMSLLGEAALAGALAGGVSGVVFGGLVALTERRHTIASLSSRRLALLGVLAGVLPIGLLALQALLRVEDSWVFIAPLLGRVVALSSILGAACAGGVLYLARRAPSLPSDHDRDSLPNEPPTGRSLKRA
jgi:hypothetical protein